MHHILPSERQNILNIIHQHLHPNGLFLIIEHNMLNPLTKKSVDNCAFDVDAHMVSPKQLKTLLHKADFIIKEKQYIWVIAQT